MGLSTSSLSRLVADLEEHLGVRLLNRTTRRLSLTDSGQAYYERCVACSQTWRKLRPSQASPPPSRVARSTHLLGSDGVQRVAPAIARFVERHSEVKFELCLDRLVDLVEEGFDLAIRVGPVGSDRLVARRLGPTTPFLCASPAYLERMERHALRPILPGTCADLCVFATPTLAPHWSRRPRLVEVRVRAACTPIAATSSRPQSAASASSTSPTSWSVTPCRMGGWCTLLPEFAGPRRRHLGRLPEPPAPLAKVRLFVDHVARHFAAAPRRLR